MFPSGFFGDLQLVEEAGRLLVYATGAEALPLLKWVGAGLSFPLPVQARVMMALGRLAHLLARAGSGFELDAATLAYRQRIEAAFERHHPVPRHLEAELRPCQEEGFRWLARLAELSLSACLADDMGLEKTVQIVALLLHRAKAGPALVVAPTSVCDNWQGELLRFAPSLRVRWYLGPERQAELAGLAAGHVLISDRSAKLTADELRSLLEG